MKPVMDPITATFWATVFFTIFYRKLTNPHYSHLVSTSVGAQNLPTRFFIQHVKPEIGTVEATD
jgi:hypothetical protein